jgi:putative hemolysin
VAAPLVWLLTVSTNGVLHLLHVPAAQRQPITEDEINLLIEQGVKAGVVAEEEQQIVERVFRTADRRVNSLMTPRREIVYLDIEDGWEESQRKITQTPHSAFPVCEGGLDNIRGIATLKRIWCTFVKNGMDASSNHIDLRSLVEEPMFTAEMTHALALLEMFKRSAGQHLALVVDEYGNLVGLVTLHDIGEGIVGELPSASEAQEGDLSAVRREDGSWLLDGMLPVSEMLDLLDLKAPPADAAEYSTLGGFVMARLSHIPSVGEHFVWEGREFEVMDMDGYRVDKVLVKPPADAGSPATPSGVSDRRGG